MSEIEQSLAKFLIS